MVVSKLSLRQSSWSAMSESIHVTTLVENSVNTRDLQAEHGLAFHIQAGSRGLLFDTGQTDLFFAQRAPVGLDLKTVGAIVLSHGHYDHTGGLKRAREEAPQRAIVSSPFRCVREVCRQC